MDRYELTLSLKFAALMARNGKRELARGAIRHVLEADVVKSSYDKALHDILVDLDVPQGAAKKNVEIANKLTGIADEVGGPDG